MTEIARLAISGQKPGEQQPKAAAPKAVSGSTEVHSFFFLMTFLKDSIHQHEIVLRLILSVALIFVLASKKRMQSKYFVMFWVEAIPIFWFCLFWWTENYF